MNNNIFKSEDRKIEIQNSIEEIENSIQKLKNNDIDVSNDYLDKIKSLREELSDLNNFSEKFDYIEFEKTFYHKKEKKEITFYFHSTGEYIKDPFGNFWLEGYNDNTDKIHWVKLTPLLEINNKWLKKNKIKIIDIEDDYEFYDDMPCDMDRSECGVTCFNCPRGN